MSHRYDAAATMARETIVTLTTLATLPYNAPKKDAMLAAAASLEVFAANITRTEAVISGEDAVDGLAVAALIDAYEEMKAVEGAAIIARIRRALDVA